MRECSTNPDTHFTKWNHYPTVHALIGHLISPRRHNAPRCCQVNWDPCAAGRHRISPVPEVTGHIQRRFGSSWRGTCAWRRRGWWEKALKNLHLCVVVFTNVFRRSAEIKCACTFSFSLMWCKMIWCRYLQTSTNTDGEGDRLVKWSNFPRLRLGKLNMISDLWRWPLSAAEPLADCFLCLISPTSNLSQYKQLWQADH